MATHFSVLAWRIPGTAEPGWAAVYGVAQSRTQLKQFSSLAAINGMENRITREYGKSTKPSFFLKIIRIGKS